ncbi:plant self-incompatibility S1 [Tanacetum coccineum]
MARGTKTTLFGLFLVSLYLVHTSDAVCFQLIWDLHITNGISNSDITIHPTDKDGHDDGEHVLHANEKFDWRFCEKFIGSTTWHSSFIWGEQQTYFPVFNDKWRKHCGKLRGAEECFWLVKEEGFYISAWGEEFPKGWEMKYYWNGTEV